ncbi:MAG: long-chain fatty acid--CoA ligase [Polyangiaceae bacterium]
MAKFETLVDVFHSAIKTFPDRELFGTKTQGEWRWTTYLEFGRMVDRVRAGFSELGLVRGDRVAIISNNRVEWAVACYACFGLGLTFVPMYEAQHAKEWEFILRDCEAKAVIAATDEIRQKLDSFRSGVASLTRVISLDAKTKADPSQGLTTWQSLLDTTAKVPTIKPEKDDVACIIYTSGTTGNPKGVMLTHWNIASNVSAIHDVFPMSSEDRSLSFLPWAHVFGQTVELHALFSMGASMALCEAIDKILDNLTEVQPSLLFSVPRIFNKLYAAVQKQISTKPGVVQSMVKIAMETRKKQRNLEEVGVGEGLVTALTDKVVFSKVRARFGGKLRYAFSGGAAISREVAEFIDGLGVTVYEGYGLTETSPIATANWPHNRRIGSVGRPIPGVRIELSPENEIIVHGPCVMKGYYNRPEENAAVFTSDGGFRTGDMGKMENGYLFITGRIKEQYKLENGKYVVPTPMEEQLKLSPYVSNVMVYGDNKPFNVALIVPNFDALKSWAGDNGLADMSKDQLLAEPKVKSLLESEIKKYGEPFKGFEEVKDFALIAEDFTTENGMLTPSLKLKRRKVMEVHGAMIDLLYKKKPQKQPQAAGAAS